jgi:hypothetical protein
MAREDGAAALYMLGLALMVLLLVAGLGLADAVRANIIKTAAARALLAATQSAARADPQDPAAVRRSFERVLDANLPGTRHQADLALVPKDGVDPLTGRQFDRATVSARLQMPFRLEYLGKWLPEIRLQLFHSEPIMKRKPAS